MLNTNGGSSTDHVLPPSATLAPSAEMPPNGAISNGAPSNGASSAVAIAAPGAASDTLDLGAMLAALWRRRRLMAGTFATILAVGTLLTLRQKSVYQATCSILMTSPNDPSASSGSALRDLLGSAASQPRSVGTQLAIMRSYPVQRAAITRLSPAEQQVAARYSKLDVNPQRDSDAIDIVAESYDARVAARLANALSAEYMWQYQQQNRAQVQASTREVADQLKAARVRLDASAAALRNFKAANGTIDLTSEAKAQLEQFNSVQATLRDLSGERAANVAQIQSLRQQIAAMPEITVAPDRIVRAPQVETLRAQLTQLELQRIATLRRYRPSSPEVRSIEAQQADVQKQLQSAAKTEVGSWVRNVNPIRQGFVQQIAQAQSQIWGIDARTRALQGAAQRQRAQQALLPGREYRLNQLVTDQGVLQQTYQLLNEKYQSLLVSEGAKLTTARTLAPAEAPPTPVRPRRMLSLLMSAMLGLAAALGLALLVDRLDDHVTSPQGAQDAAQLPVLTQVPFIPNAADRTLLALNGPSPLLESYRALRTNLMLPLPALEGRRDGAALGTGKTLRSLLVTSSREGEGKSLCALNLAIATALSGRQVVLIECDLRQPSLRQLLRLPHERGLSDVVAGRVALEDALQRTSVPGLRVLTAGSYVENATELLDSHAARQILHAAIARADFAVLDCPPTPLVADTQIVASVADGALLVVSLEEAESSEVARARDSLARTGVPLLGMVVNKVKASAALYSYGYGRARAVKTSETAAS